MLLGKTAPVVPPGISSGIASEFPAGMAADIGPEVFSVVLLEITKSTLKKFLNKPLVNCLKESIKMPGDTFEDS